MRAALLSKIFIVSCIYRASLYFLSNAGHKIIKILTLKVRNYDKRRGSCRIYVKEELIWNLSETRTTEGKYGSPLCKMCILPGNNLSNKNVSLNAFCKWTVLIYIAGGEIYFPSSSFTGAGTCSNLSIRIYLNQNWFEWINLESPYRFIFVVAWSFTICISDWFPARSDKRKSLAKV